MQPAESILEGIVTTENADGSTAIAPMGPIATPAMNRLVFRPFQTSNTYVNLRRTRQCIFHVTDNVLMIAQAAIGQLDPSPKLIPCDAIAGQIVADACRWYACRIISMDDSPERASLVAEVVASGHLREFFGFNRAKHAVLEAAILATRVHLLSADQIRAQLDPLISMVEKTGSSQERTAFDLLHDYLAQAWRQPRWRNESSS